MALGQMQTPAWFCAAHELRIVFAAAAKSLQSCPTLCNSIDSSPPGSPMPGILQASVPWEMSPQTIVTVTLLHHHDSLSLWDKIAIGR